MKSSSPLLGSLLFIVAYGNHDSNSKHQERTNRMVPDFQPFQHPAKKFQSSGSLTSGSGPISDVEWVEEVVPVFGKMYTPPKRDKEGQGSNVLIFFGLILGGLIFGAYFKNKCDLETTEKKKTEKRRDGLDHETIKVKNDCTLDIEPAKKIHETSTNGVDKKMQEIKHPKNETIYGGSKIKMEKEVDIKTEELKLIDKKSEVRLKEALIEVKDIKVTAPPTVQVNHEVIKAPERVKTTQVPLNKRKISQATNENSEDPEWITKIKTFKITKYPKTNNADICEHGSTQNAVDILDVVELEKTEDMKTTIKTAIADMNIEGANTSRLRITVVVVKNEEESVSKTMTLKEYTVSISNKIIEDAVRRVKEECSMENIKHLAETIRKFRPESAEIKNVKCL